MNIKPIKKVNVGEQVFDQLKKMIIDGKWTQGSKIPSENELANQFQVSRVTIRQALQKLNTLGLLETKLGEGSFVKTLDIGSSMNALIPTFFLGDRASFQVFEFREIMETQCARLAATRAEQEDIENLTILLEQMVEAKEKGDLKEFARVDLDFHFKIAQLTQNELIIKANSILKDILQTSMVEVIDKMGYENGLYYHRKILDAIIQRDGDKAMLAMQEHIRKNSFYFNTEDE